MALIRTVHPDLLAALQGPFFYPVIMVWLDWPEHEIRVHSSVGTISWDGHDWLGVGGFGEVAIPEEAHGMASRPAQLKLVGLPDDLDEQLEAPIRNRDGVIYFGAVTERGGNVLIGEPFAIYDGYMDAMRDIVEGSDGRLTRGVILSLAAGPSQRAFAEIYHTYEDQIRAYPPVPIEAEEEIENGDFSDGLNGWIDDNGHWAAVGGAAYHASSTEFNMLRAPLELKTGERYEIRYTLTGLTGQVRVQFRDESSGAAGGSFATHTEDGTYSAEFDAEENYAYIAFARHSAATATEFTLDDVSIKAVDPVMPGDTAGRLVINAEAEAGKLTWPE